MAKKAKLKKKPAIEIYQVGSGDDETRPSWVFDEWINDGSMVTVMLEDDCSFANVSSGTGNSMFDECEEGDWLMKVTFKGLGSSVYLLDGESQLNKLVDIE